MKYTDFLQIPVAERGFALDSLTAAERAHLIDQQPLALPEFTEEPNNTYFETIEVLYEYLLKSHVPLTKPWMAAEIAGHELAHGTCALAVGAVGVKYFVSLDHEQGRRKVYTNVHGPIELPRLALATIAIHPHDATTSTTDMGIVEASGYSSRQQVIDRINYWNEQGYELTLPLPRTEPLLYTPGS